MTGLAFVLVFEVFMVTKFLFFVSVTDGLTCSFVTPFPESKLAYV